MKILHFLLGLTLAFCLTSCGDITEEITLNEDGSGSYHLEYDMVPMMTEMSFQMVKAFSAMDTTKPAKSDEEIRAMVEQKIWEEFPDKIDSVIDYKEQLPDSILNDPEKMKIINNAHGFMRGGKEEGVMMSGIHYNFSSVDQLDEFFEILEDNNPDKRKMKGLEFGGTQSVFTFEKGRFTRKTAQVTKPSDEGAENLERMKEMFGDSKFRTVIHLPREVSKVKSKNLVSQEGKKVVLEYGMMDLMRNEVSTDFDITLNKK